MVLMSEEPQKGGYKYMRTTDRARVQKTCGYNGAVETSKQDVEVVVQQKGPRRRRSVATMTIDHALYGTVQLVTDSWNG